MWLLGLPKEEIQKCKREFGLGYGTVTFFFLVVLEMR